MISFLLIGCEKSENNITEINETNALNTKIAQLKSQVTLLETDNNELKQLIEDKDSFIEDLEYSIAVGRGFAVQYTFDMQILYDELKCPNYTTNSQEERLIIEELLGKLKEDSQFVNRKIVTLKLFPMEDNGEWNYFVNGVTFKPQDKDELKNYIENGEGIPYPSVKSYAIWISVHGNTLNYEIMQ